MHRHRRELHAHRQPAQPAVLEPAGGEQHLRPGGLEVAEELDQLVLFALGPGTGGAGGEPGDGFDVVPHPQHRHHTQHLQHQIAADGRVDNGGPVDVVGLQQRGERGPDHVQVQVTGLEASPVFERER